MDLGQGLSLAQTLQVNKTVDCQQAKAMALTGELLIAAPGPFTWMAYDPGANHVEVDGAQAIPQMIAAINHGATESFSRGAATVLAGIIVLSKLTLQLLYETAEVPETVAHPKEVDMDAGDTRVKESNPVLADSISQAGAVFDSVESVAQKELAVEAAVRQVIDLSRLDVTIGTLHRESYRKAN